MQNGPWVAFCAVDSHLNPRYSKSDVSHPRTEECSPRNPADLDSGCSFPWLPAVAQPQARRRCSSTFSNRGGLGSQNTIPTPHCATNQASVLSQWLLAFSLGNRDAAAMGPPLQHAL